MARVGSSGVARTQMEHIMLKSLRLKLKAWQRYRDNVRELSRLTDRELADLGFSRVDIPAIARSNTQPG